MVERVSKILLRSADSKSFSERHSALVALEHSVAALGALSSRGDIENAGGLGAVTGNAEGEAIGENLHAPLWFVVAFLLPRIRLLN